ncbi:flagellar type III secretion system protein FlhB [Paracoccus lutimaris]|uniref:Flagellar biosynthetic protein FlhB n=1 Tax=Paracoccus lutimaris TaxID=1490030 RepID=A0A368YRM1_9RHOB|nr:flagellar type III secretion system protein FlhB [Paracoccus lutimaris]RCW82871.1 flagellar biosynthetic protein FlhB [Paracoccus lutimaris]
MSEESDDKQFDPSESKLRKARQEGDIPRSAELQSVLMYLGAWFAMSFAMSWAVPGWISMASRLMGSDPWPDAVGHSATDLAWGVASYAAFATIAMVVIMTAPIILGLVAQRSIVFTPKKLLPDFKRVNPIKNAGQKFGKSGLATFAISAGKAVLVGIGGWLLYASLLSWLVTADAMADQQWVVGLGVILRRSLMLALAVGAAFACIDLLWKRLEYLKRNRMSRQEMQDEHKESEGDPHLKAARRQKGVDIVLNSMLANVEKADVVIVNPTHYAVALEWKRGSGLAPVCLAKGVDEVARRIRERANEHQVPIWSDPPCARALHATVEIGDEIRSEHFAPVAAAIRFAEAMRKKAREGWRGLPLQRTKQT